jgi:hypothetical protein
MALAAGELHMSEHSGTSIKKGRGMTVVVRLPSRRQAIFVLKDDDGLLVLAPNDHGWLHSDLDAAYADATWLSRNFGLPILNST